MHAHINIWTMNAEGATSDNTTAREVGERLREQPGFVSYTLARTGEREMVAVTVFQSPDQLHQAMQKVGAFVDDRVRPLASGSPRRREGDVLYHVTGHPPRGDG